MGASEEQLDRIDAATHMVIVSVQTPAGLAAGPRMGDPGRRRSSSAQLVGGDIIDIANHQVLDVDAAPRPCPTTRAGPGWPTGSG